MDEPLGKMMRALILGLLLVGGYGGCLEAERVCATTCEAAESCTQNVVNPETCACELVMADDDTECSFPNEGFEPIDGKCRSGTCQPSKQPCSQDSDCVVGLGCIPSCDTDSGLCSDKLNCNIGLQDGHGPCSNHGDCNRDVPCTVGVCVGSGLNSACFYVPLAECASQLCDPEWENTGVPPVALDGLVARRGLPGDRTCDEPCVADAPSLLTPIGEASGCNDEATLITTGGPQLLTASAEPEVWGKCVCDEEGKFSCAGLLESQREYLVWGKFDDVSNPAALAVRGYCVIPDIDNLTGGWVGTIMVGSGFETSSPVINDTLEMDLNFTSAGIEVTRPCVGVGSCSAGTLKLNPNEVTASTLVVSGELDTGEGRLSVRVELNALEHKLAGSVFDSDGEIIGYAGLVSDWYHRYATWVDRR